MGVQIKNCPFCGGTDLINARPSHSALYGDSITSACALRHIVCRNCGSVVYSYVDNPELLLKKKDRKAQ